MKDSINFSTQNSFLHHGILGQKWGIQNGPPYPLGSDKSTGSRLKSAFTKDIFTGETRREKKMRKLSEKHAEYAAKVANQRQQVEYQRAKNDLEKQKASSRDLRREKWFSDIRTGETAAQRHSREIAEHNANVMYNRQLQAQRNAARIQEQQNSLGNTLKRALISASGTLLTTAATQIGNEYISKATEMIREKNMTPQQKAQRDALAKLKYDSDVASLKKNTLEYNKSLLEYNKKASDYKRESENSKSDAEFEKMSKWAQKQKIEAEAYKAARDSREYQALMSAVYELESKGARQTDIYRFIKRQEKSDKEIEEEKEKEKENK